MYGVEEKVKEEYRKHFESISPDWEAQVERIVGLTIQLLENEVRRKVRIGMRNFMWHIRNKSEEK